MVQCHMQAGCMAAWFNPDNDHNITCSYCICMNDGMYVNDIAGAALHMIDFGKFIPGKISYSRDIVPISHGILFLMGV